MPNEITQRLLSELNVKKLEALKIQLKKEEQERKLNLEAELLRTKYIKVEGSINTTDKKFSVALETLENTNKNTPEYRQAQKILHDREIFLRKKAVTPQLREFMNLAKIGAPTDQEVHNYLPEGENYSADHIVSFKKIWNLDAFKKLGIVDQLTIIRDPENFQPLSKARNSSKKDFSYSGDKAWKTFKGKDITNDKIYQEATAIERVNLKYLSDKINKMLSMKKEKEKEL